MNWLGVVDDELQLVRLKGLKKTASAEHIDFFKVNTLPIELNNFLEGDCPDATNDCAFLYALGSEAPLLCMYKLCLSEAHTLLKRIDFLKLIFYLVCLAIFSRDREAESNGSFQDHEDGLSRIAFTIDEILLFEYLQFNCLDYISDKFALLERIFQDLSEDVKALQALLKHLFRQIKFDEHALVVGLTTGPFGLWASALQVEAFEIQSLRFGSALLHCNYIQALIQLNILYFILRKHQDKIKHHYFASPRRPRARLPRPLPFCWAFCQSPPLNVRIDPRARSPHTTKMTTSLYLFSYVVWQLLSSRVSDRPKCLPCSFEYLFLAAWISLSQGIGSGKPSSSRECDFMLVNLVSQVIQEVSFEYRPSLSEGFFVEGWFYSGTLCGAGWKPWWLLGGVNGGSGAEWLCRSQVDSETREFQLWDSTPLVCIQINIKNNPFLRVDSFIDEESI